MSYDFPEKLERAIIKALEEYASDFVEARNESVYEMGESRGFIRGLKHALELIGAVESEMNNDTSTGFTGKTIPTI